MPVVRGCAHPPAHHVCRSQVKLSFDSAEETAQWESFLLGQLVERDAQRERERELSKVPRGRAAVHSSSGATAAAEGGGGGAAVAAVGAGEGRHAEEERGGGHGAEAARPEGEEEAEEALPEGYSLAVAAELEHALMEV